MKPKEARLKRRNVKERFGKYADEAGEGCALENDVC